MEQSGEMIKMQDVAGSASSFLQSNRVYDPTLSSAEGEVKMIEVPIVSLDEDITEAITFLKMDIEGSEMNAIRGAKNHILNEKPLLAICTYHHYEHLWEVMQEIKRIRPDYKFYMRFYGNLGSVAESEHVLYAV